MSNRIQNDTKSDIYTTFSLEDVQFSLSRLLESRSFRAAHSQRKFLRFVVEETLAGRGSQIKEFTVGVEAFGRGDSFDPRVDPIIRTEARKLRLRLSKYYEEEGCADPVRIELPKGSYIPVFHPRSPSVEGDSEETPEPVEEPAAPELVEQPAPKRRFPAHIAGAALAGILATALWFAFRQGAADEANSIAVMPFANRSGDPDQNIIADGITASLIELLSRESRLRVAGRDSVTRSAATSHDLNGLKRQLGVNAVLTGSMEKSGSSYRLRVRLIEQPDTSPVWSGSYTFDPQIHEAIEAEIAAEVLHVLRKGKPLKKPPSSDPVKRVPRHAWSAYLEGLHFMGRPDAANLNQAIERFDKAIKADAGFARAYGALANAWVLAAQVAGMPGAEVSGKIRMLATRALELDPTLGDAHFSLAVCAQYEYDWKTAEQEFRTGLALSPSSTFGHLWYAKYLALTGRHREVLVHRTLSAEIDPLSPYAIQAVAGYWSVMGEYPQAIAGFRSALALDPNFGLAKQGLGIAYLLTGQFEQAVAELESASSIQRGLRTQSLLGYAYAVAGRTDKARKMLAEFEERERRGPFPALAIAHIHLGLGDKNRAFDWLEKAVDQRDLSATLQWDSLYVPLRSDQRYFRLLRRMRLA